MAEGLVALNVELALFVAQAGNATVIALGERGLVGVVDLAVEAREIGVRADRLLDRAPSAGAVEARQHSVGAGDGIAPVALLAQHGEILSGAIHMRIDAQRLLVVGHRAVVVALASPGGAAIVVGAHEAWIELERAVVVGNGAVIIALGVVGIAAVGQETGFRPQPDRLVEIGDGAVVVAILLVGQAAVIEIDRIRGLDLDRLALVGERLYILSGNVSAKIGEETHELSPGHFGLISTGVRHSWHGASEGPMRWLEMQAPQPRPAEYGRDTFFVSGDLATRTTLATPDRAAGSLIGHFDESQLPRASGPSQMEGFNPTTGVAIKMFVDRSFGAIHQSLFLIQYMPGAKIDPHDHTFEESYLIVAGRVQATADGKAYDLGPGDVIWTSVGCIHSFENIGTEPVRWIETQAPLPPSKEVFRFERDWVGREQDVQAGPRR